MATSPCTRALLERDLGATLRVDRWWLLPLLHFAVLIGFVIYSTWAAVWGARYISHGPYLSPMYSPLLALDSVPAFITPSMLILWAPAGFRFTCYYIRRVYYRAFAAQPLACGVGKPWKIYNGERVLLVFQNLHRFFMYLAVILIVLHLYDLYLAFFGWAAAYETIHVGAAAGALDPHHAIGPTQFGIGIGSLVLLTDVILLSGYVFGCHSFRHLVGGCLDCPSKAPLGQLRHQIWKGSTWLNEKHGGWAWVSLLWVGFTDFYVRACSMGWISADFDRLL